MSRPSSGLPVLTGHDGEIVGASLQTAILILVGGLDHYTGAMLPGNLLSAVAQGAQSPFLTIGGERLQRALGRASSEVYVVVVSPLGESAATGTPAG